MHPRLVVSPPLPLEGGPPSVPADPSGLTQHETKRAMSSRLEEVDFIWKNGEFIRWQDAQVHLLSLAVQFGSSVFEGIRCYDSERGPAIFRLDAHIRRLYDSCRIYRMEPDVTPDAYAEACTAIVAKNGLRDCYIRPMVLRGYGAAGLNPEPSPIEAYVASWPWGTYLGHDALEKRRRCLRLVVATRGAEHVPHASQVGRPLQQCRGS